MVREIMDYISSCDEAVGKALYAEYHRQQRNLELIASENIVSPAVMLAMGTVPTNKYAEGYPEKRYYGGCEEVDVLEDLAIERAKKLFGAEHACVQPHSGASANLAVYQAFLEQGDTVMGMNLAHGGHLTHGSPVNISGRLYHFIPYNVNADGVLDYEEIRRLALEHQPKMIVAGASAYPREIRFDLFAEIAKEVGAYLFVDMAHIAGLVAAGLHQNPVLYADVVSTTTHKTLRGPRGGMILCKKEYAKQIDKANFPGNTGRSSDACDRSEGCLLRGGIKAGVSDVSGTGGKKCKSIVHCIDGRGIPSCEQRNRQSSDACRSAKYEHYRKRTSESTGQCIYYCQ